MNLLNIEGGRKIGKLEKNRLGKPNIRYNCYICRDFCPMGPSIGI